LIKDEIMKTEKPRHTGNSDTDKALAKVGVASERKVEKQTDIFSDTVRDEKDEVKDAEERMRLTRKKDTK
jgi:hypothetical protein